MTLSPDQATEIALLRAQSAATARPTVPALEALLYEAVPVLDHGFVRVIDYMGDDAAIVQAARVSYGRGTKNDLGYGLEFQSGVDLFYRMARGWRAGATLRHVSNAGLSDINPGIETLALLVAIPVR